MMHTMRRKRNAAVSPMRRLALMLLVLTAGLTTWGQRYTISGIITSSETGETLIGATVYDLRSQHGAVSNAYGRYSLTLPNDSVTLLVAFVGYASDTLRFRLSANREVNIALMPHQQLREVVVTAERINSPQSSQMSAINVPVEHLKAVPVIFGETDVLKAIQLLPGVQSGGEGSAGMYVRGGGPDENLFLLDGVPLYNVNHMGGFFSAFNSDAVKNVTLYKGSFPAHFGGRLSSVLDVTTNDGNANKLHGGFNVGAIAAKVYLEGPIVKDKTTFSISARRTYFDVLLQPFIATMGASDGLVSSAGYYFYDLNAKVTHRFNDRSRLFLSCYSGDDVLYAKVKTREGLFNSDYSYREYMKLRYGWGNLVASARWNYVINPKLFMNVTGAYTRYRNSVGLTMEDEYYGYDTQDQSLFELGMTYKSGIRDITGRVDFDYAPNPDHIVKFGGSLTHHIFTPEVASVKATTTEGGTIVRDESIDTTVGGSRVHASELNAYIEDDWKINDRFKVNAGVALAAFAVEKKVYPSLQPRLSGRMLLTDELSLKVGYARTTQYMHLLSNSAISLPTDLWVPVTARIAPMTANQVAAGLSYNVRYLFDVSLEGYYKQMNNLMEYRDGASFFGTSTNWEDKVCLGRGWAYGVELLLQRSVGEFTGWIGYTWSHTDRLFDKPGQELNNGKVFPAKYDRRHDISIVAMYKFSDHFEASISWVYSTGNTATLAYQEFENPNDNSYYDDYYYDYSESLNYYSGRNNFRMPAYHRMDISLSWHKQLKRGIRTWNISVYNVYNRKNPYLIYESSNFRYTAADGTMYNSALVQLSLFPIIPSVSYSFKF